MTRARDLSRAVNNKMTVFKYTATAGQTTFTGADGGGATLAYNPNSMIVTYNGIILESTSEYTATNGTSVVLTTGAEVGAEVNILAFEDVAYSGVVPTTGGTFTGNVNVSGTLGTGATSITGNLSINGTVSASKGSEATDPESDIGIYHSFKNTSATLNTGVGILLGSNDNGGTCIYGQRTGANNEHRLGFQTRNSSGSSTTAMVIDGSGNTIWNGGGFSTSNINAGSHSGAYISDAGTLYTSRATSSYSLHWYIQNSNGQVGSIATDGSGTIFGTTSDKRLKTDIKPIENATDKLMSMNPINHKWKSNPDLPAVDGFIAQEMIDIIPESVGKPENDDEMMNMDYGRITPVIVAALQDAHNEIKRLKEKIESMENTNE